MANGWVRTKSETINDIDWNTSQGKSFLSQISDKDNKIKHDLDGEHIVLKEIPVSVSKLMSYNGVVKFDVNTFDQVGLSVESIDIKDKADIEKVLNIINKNVFDNIKQN